MRKLVSHIASLHVQEKNTKLFLKMHVEQMFSILTKSNLPHFYIKRVRKQCVNVKWRRFSCFFNTTFHILAVKIQKHPQLIFFSFLLI